MRTKFLGLVLLSIGIMAFGDLMGQTRTVKLQDLNKTTWQNELGSTLEVKGVNLQNGSFWGIYRSPSGTKGEGFKFTGFVNHALRSVDSSKHEVTVLSFLVSWGKYGSITAWTGYIANDDPAKIITNWILARPVTNFPFEHLITGSDNFTKL